MLIKQVARLFPEQLPLEHVPDNQVCTLYACDDLFESIRFQDSIRLYDGDGKGQIKLFGVEQCFLSHISCIFAKSIIIDHSPIFKSNMLKYFAESKADTSSRFAAQDFLFRWKKLQRLLEKENLEALLLITGIDGSDTNQTTYLFSWLFLGLSGKSIFANKFLDPVYSEMIVLIGVKESFIFLTPEAKAQLEPLLYMLPNTTIFCPTEAQYSNKEELDVLKIAFFYKMVCKTKKIAVNLSAGAEAKSIEKWPLIQSYALEPVGNSFFTLKHETVNLNAKIQPLFKNLDKHGLKMILSQTIYSMQGHIKGTTQLIECTKFKERRDISETKLQESLAESVDLPEGDNSIRVLFGDRVRSATFSSSPTETIQSAYHATIQHFNPLTKLAVWRTYFLDLNLKTILTLRTLQEQAADTFLTATKYVLEEQENIHFNQQQAILKLYLNLVLATLESISIVSKDYRNLNIGFLSEYILTKLKSQYLDLKLEELEILLESYDALGQSRPIDFKDSISFKLSSTYYVLKCKLRNVVFSECFLLQQGCYLLLTKHIDYFDFCKTSLGLNLQNLNPNYPFEKLGAAVSGQSFKIRLFIPLEHITSAHFSIPLICLKCMFHERGLRIFSDKTGWMVLLYQDILEATMINKIPGEWVLFKLNRPFLFDAFESCFISLEFRGKPFQVLMKTVHDKSLKLAYIDTIPDILRSNQLFWKQVLRRKDETAIQHHEILQDQFLWQFLEAKQMMILKQMKDLKLSTFRSLYEQKGEKKIVESQPEPNKSSIIILNGSYASEGTKLAETLLKFAPQKLKFHVFSVPAENLFMKMKIPSFLASLKECMSGCKDATTIVVVPSWINSAELMVALEEIYHIRSAVSVISTGNFFVSRNGELVQNVLTFALPGYAQTVIIDTHGESQSLINRITKIVWGVSREARITRSSNGMLSTGQCKDILNQNTFQNDYNRFLRNKYACFYRFDALAQLSLHYIAFKLPIDHMDIFKELFKNQGYLINLPAILKELKPKRNQAEHSKDDLMVGLYLLEELLTIERKKAQSMQVRFLRGIVRGKEGYREVIVGNELYLERKAKQDQSLLGFSVLSRAFNEFELVNFLESGTCKTEALKEIQPLRKKTDITEQQRREIEKKNRSTYLQNGDFFDGHFYRDAEGHILPGHPAGERLVEEAVSSMNKQIEQRNESIHQEWLEYRKKYQ